MKPFLFLLPGVVLGCSSTPSGPGPVATGGGAAAGGMVATGGADASAGAGGAAMAQDGAAAAVDVGSTGADATLPKDGAPARGEDGALVTPTADANLGADGSAPGPSAAEACAVFASAACSRLQACSPFGVSALYGDTTRCQERIGLGCLPLFDAAGTSATPAKTSACAQSLQAIPCATLARGDFGPACATQPGTLVSGAACGDDAQCASTFCARASDAICGICAETTRAGDPCVRGACSAGTTCPAGQSSCIAPVAGQIGDACTVVEQCDVANAVGCDTIDRRCIRLTLAPSNGPCGANSLIGPSSFALCPASGTCSALLNGTCSGSAADGASCSTSGSGPSCMPPARCVTGTCTAPSPASCR
jgi:hypothetical protein